MYLLVLALESPTLIFTYAWVASGMGTSCSMVKICAVSLICFEPELLLTLLFFSMAASHFTPLHLVMSYIGRAT